jgi:hypothetical protein
MPEYLYLRVVFKRIFAPTGKVGAYASVGFGFSRPYARVGTYGSFKKLPSGANPMIVSYNASAVKTYNATGSLVRFESKYIVFCFE